MKTIKTLVLAALLLASAQASAQYTQQKAKCEYMFKIEAGYMANWTNFGTPKKPVSDISNMKEQGYNLNLQEQAIGLNIINGANVSQDFFLGGGLGYAMCAPLARENAFSMSSHMAHAFFDMDFRPVGDTWAPMLGLRLGGSFLMNPNNYGNTISPYFEFYAGLNWFYDHALQQMDRNYHSLFVEAGIVLEQQTVFVPIRIGWRL